jgi:putative transposase
MDFMADRLEDGRRIRILTVEDVFTRECLAVEVDTSMPSGRVVEVLAPGGGPRSPDGCHGRQRLRVLCPDDRRLGLSARGPARLQSPREADGQSVHRELQRPARDEHLNVELFFSVPDARTTLLEWQRDYNEVRPHSALAQRPPREFVAAWPSTRIAGGEILNPETI